MELTYLRNCLAKIQPVLLQDNSFPAEEQISPKMHRLVDFLVEEQSPSFTGIVFVRTRAEVAVLSHLLSIHTGTKDAFTVSTFVGASNVSSRRANIAELVDVRNQTNTLDDFRSGRKNLVISTSALEEGIDISACNVVICFEKPPNLTSFVQRRGRARKSASKFVLMLCEDEDPNTLQTWQQLEESMRQAYMDDMRLLQEIQSIEETQESDKMYIVESTGAKLTLAASISHLYHFCTTLSSRQYTDARPLFILDTKRLSDSVETITAKVVLPISVDSSLREASGSAWQTEKYAKRDAAFEAYVQLHRAGLVSDNLLPSRGYDGEAAEASSAIQKIASLVETAAQLDPWRLAAREWQMAGENSKIYESTITVYEGDEVVLAMQILLPCPVSDVPPVNLYWDANTTFTATIDPTTSTVHDPEKVQNAALVTSMILSSVHGKRMEGGKMDFATLFCGTAAEETGAWLDSCTGTISGEDICAINLSKSSMREIGLVRDSRRAGDAFLLRDIAHSPIPSPDPLVEGTLTQEPVPEYEILLRASKFPRRTDFLHRLSEQSQDQAVQPTVLALRLQDCKVDRLPSRYACFAALVPSVLHRIGLHLLTQHLMNTLLSSVDFSDVNLVTAAISTSAARETVNYQRLEFLGDSVLKFFTSLTLVSQHLQWHEGILSSSKDRIVSNSSLARAALEQGLDEFIITKPFTGRKWRPLYVSELLADKVPEPRELSTKTLADVVEALIGASWLDGGAQKALACLRVFLRDVSWSPIDRTLSALHDAYQFDVPFPPQFSRLEDMLNYKFTLKSLPVEALTHPSYFGLNVSTSYERLEFLGDSILDNIVVSTAYSHEPPIPTLSLHLIRTAVVNAQFLAFACLTLSTPCSRTNMVINGSDIVPKQEWHDMHIWSFMRHASPEIRKAQMACVRRYEALREPIQQSLMHGDHVPWALLARLNAPKFFSDLVESLLGAIFIDSRGSMAACEGVLQRLGVMGYLRRVMSGTVRLWHPKEELGQLAETEEVKYLVSKKGGELDDSEFVCAVKVGEREIARVDGGINWSEVEIRVADEAVRILKLERTVESCG
ncbi:MAG: hypothetical protein Q9190_004944 [Brigantiaea leucoxantha]